VPKKCQKVAIVRRTIVKGSTCGEEKRFSLLANASSARTPRDQLIDQLSVVWVRGALFWVRGAVVIENNNNNKRLCGGTRIFDGDKCANLLWSEAGAHNVANADDDNPVRSQEFRVSNAICSAFSVGRHR
jgi:hypothetical protein